MQISEVMAERKAAEVAINEVAGAYTYTFENVCLYGCAEVRWSCS